MRIIKRSLVPIVRKDRKMSAPSSAGVDHALIARKSSHSPPVSTGTTTSPKQKPKRSCPKTDQRQLSLLSAGVDLRSDVRRSSQISRVNTGTALSPKRSQRQSVRKDQEIDAPFSAGVDHTGPARKSSHWDQVNTGTTIMSLDDLCQCIKDSYREHIGLERARISVSNRLGADARQLAWQRHAKLGTLPERGFPEVDKVDEDQVRKVRWRLHSILAGLTAFDKEVDKELTHYVSYLPIADIIKTIPGFGAMSLGAIVGSAGNLSHYAKYSQLWKRMGVGLHDGQIQKKRKGISGEEALAIGYNEERRAVMRVISLSLIKVQGYYREVYLARKQFEVDKAEAAGLTVLPAAKITAKTRDTSMSLGHVDKRALRYTEKRLLRKLWAVWRQAAATEIIVADPPSPKMNGG